MISTDDAVKAILGMIESSGESRAKIMLLPAVGIPGIPEIKVPVLLARAGSREYKIGLSDGGVSPSDVWGAIGRANVPGGRPVTVTYAGRTREVAL